MPPTIRKLTGRIGALVDGVDHAHPNVPAADGTTNVLAVDSETSKANEGHTDVTFGVDGRRSEQLVGDASHYSTVLEVAA